MSSPGAWVVTKRIWPRGPVEARLELKGVALPRGRDNPRGRQERKVPSDKVRDRAEVLLERRRRDVAVPQRAQEEGELWGRECDGCRRVLVPPRMYCERCYRPTDRWVRLRDSGKVVTYSIAYVNSDASRRSEPIVVAVIEIDGASPLMGILHLLGEVAPEKVRIGMRVEAVWRPDDERYGSITDIKYFRPATEERLDHANRGEARVRRGRDAVDRRHPPPLRVHGGGSRREVPARSQGRKDPERDTARAAGSRRSLQGSTA